MKEIIGIFGSAVYLGSDIDEKAKSLGFALAQENVRLITGACSGLPYQVAKTAFQTKKTEIWGFSPAIDFEEQVRLTPDDDNQIYSKLIYVDKRYEDFDISIRRKMRNISSTAACHAGIIIAGRWGTLNEVSNLYDMGKVIGVLTGTGGAADKIEELNTEFKKPSDAIFIHESNPVLLVTKLLIEIRTLENS